MVYKFFDRKASGSGIKMFLIKNQLKNDTNQLLKLLLFNKRKVHSHFIYNIWGVDLADMQFISKFNKAFRFFLCVIDSYSKYA